MLLTTRSADETEQVGARLGRALRGGEVVLLSGELGAGKSVLARGVARALGSTSWRGSPTFNLIHEYSTQPRLFHIDAYRLCGEEVEELGIEELVGPDSVVVVEWADRAASFLHSLSSEILQVTLSEVGPETRVIALSGAVVCRLGGMPC
jgi:tRNA threonylcarbamoyladenosine biosynthesis protein TsaE